MCAVHDGWSFSAVIDFVLAAGILIISHSYCVCEDGDCTVRRGYLTSTMHACSLYEGLDCYMCVTVLCAGVLHTRTHNM